MKRCFRVVDFGTAGFPHAVQTSWFIVRLLSSQLNATVLGTHARRSHKSHCTWVWFHSYGFIKLECRHLHVQSIKKLSAQTLPPSESEVRLIHKTRFNSAPINVIPHYPPLLWGGEGKAFDMNTAPYWGNWHYSVKQLYPEHFCAEPSAISLYCTVVNIMHTWDSDKETVTDVNWMELATIILRLQCKQWHYKITGILYRWV